MTTRGAAKSTGELAASDRKMGGDNAVGAAARVPKSKQGPKIVMEVFPSVEEREEEERVSTRDRESGKKPIKESSWKRLLSKPLPCVQQN